MTGFNLFRINCWLDDMESVNYNSAILSLVCEFLYDNKNTQVERSKCLKHVNDDLKLKMNEDLFNSLLEESGYFEFSTIQDDVLVKLTKHKFADVDRKVCQESIEFYIDQFSKEKSWSKKLKKRVKELLFSSIYENINTFSTEDIKTILSDKNKSDFNQKEIDAFNTFLEWGNRKKNNALYHTFLKAVEFAIVTSGRGIKEVSKDVFTNKTYYLDTNIILRLIGVGGEERKESLHNLLDSCVHEGIKFNYSYSTHMEFNRITKERCTQIANTIDKASSSVLEELVSNDFIPLNNSFETHYAKLKADKVINNVNQYSIRLSTEFEALRNKYNINGEATKSNFKKFAIKQLTNKLHKAKKNDYKVRYSMTAAEVDAVNVLHVRSIRGGNNYNYADIKSFYLTTDRTLNKILSEEGTKRIPETILPSQLFLLHHSQTGEISEHDYKTFVRFLKRRNTEFKIHGAEVLEYIDIIRNYTGDKEKIKAALKVYSNRKYESPPQNLKREAKIMSLNKFTESYFDKRLSDAERGSSKYYGALNDAVEAIPKKYKQSVVLANLIEFVLVIALSILIFLINKSYQLGIGAGIVLLILSKGINFLLKGRLGFHNYMTNGVFWEIIKSSPFLKSFKDDENYIRAAKEFIEGK